MKKKLFVNFVLFLELVMLALYVVNLKFTNISSIVPLNYVISITEIGIDKLVWLSEIVQIKYLVNLLLGFNMPGLEFLLALLLANIAWIIVFYIIFGTIGAIAKHNRKKKIRKVISEYKLTPTEEKRFASENYKKKATRWVGKSLIIPIVVMAILVLARFDVENVPAWGLQINNSLGLNIYSKYILPIIDMVLEPIQINNYVKVLFTNEIGIGYFDLVNTYLSQIAWLEYIVLGVVCILVVLIWWLIFKLISLIFRKAGAKRLSKKAKAKYIAKMEKQEYKLRKKYKDDATIKGDEFLKIIEEELEEEALEIAKIKEEKSSRHQKKIDARKKAYLEEIGYGVVDLGVAKEDNAKKATEPLVEREIRYISDADIDIILDEEPVIEIVEEDDMEVVELEKKEDDLFFEKYHEDDVDLDLVEEHKPEPKDVIKYVEEKAKPKEEIVKEEPVVETPIEEEKIEVEKFEEILTDEIEEPIKEEKTTPEVKEEPVVKEKVEEEAPKKVDPFAAYRNRVNKGHGAKKVQSFKDAGFKEDEMMVREDGVKVSIKYDPFAKWRAQERKKGYGAKKVPSFKELQALKEKENAQVKKEEPKKAAPTKKENPFAAYQNKPKQSSGSKKVPPMKKEETPKVEEKVEVKPAPKKENLFAKNQNSPRAGTGSKKVPPMKKEEAPKVEEKVEVKPASKKENPFAKNQNSPRAGTGSKKVPPMKKEEPKKEVKKEEVKTSSPSKNDPFAAYRNKINKK